MKKPLYNHQISGLFTFALICLFALLALLVSTLGARAYSSIINTSEDNNTTRAAFNYIANKIRSSDIAGGISIYDSGGVQILALAQEAPGEKFEIRIYSHGGAMYEQFADTGDEFSPELGERLVDVDGFSAELGDGFIKLYITLPGGERTQMNIALRSAAGGL